MPDDRIGFLEEQYRQFLDLKQRGLKVQARALADELITTYATGPDYEFILNICDSTPGRIDHLIWRRLVLPALEPRLADDPQAIRAMVLTIQTLYADKATWKRLGYITDLQLTNTLLKLRPGDPWGRQAKTRQLQRWLAYTIHEWPGGVLYGADGASLDECGEILTAVDELLELDEAGSSTPLCDDVRAKVAIYKVRLAGRAGF